MRCVMHAAISLSMYLMLTFTLVGSMRKDLKDVTVILCSDILLITDHHAESNTFTLLIDAIILAQSSIVQVFYDDALEFAVEEVAPEHVSIFSCMHAFASICRCVCE